VTLIEICIFGIVISNRNLYLKLNIAPRFKPRSGYVRRVFHLSLRLSLPLEVALGPFSLPRAEKWP